MAKDDIGGVWRTVGGRRIFIKDGEDLATAMKKSGKFGNKKQEKEANNKNENENEYKKYENFDEEIKELEEESDKVYQEAREIGTIGSINTYTEEYYMDVNYYLRNNNFPPDAPSEYKDYVKKIVTDTEKTINKFELKENITTYKGTSSEYYKDYKVGDTFEMKEFNSTSINKEVATNNFKDKQNPYTLEIRASKGTNAIYLGKNSANSNEYELLINKGTSYKVIEKNENGMILEVIKNVK